MRENIFYAQKAIKLLNDIYSCNKITKTFIKISLKLKWLFSNISHRQKNKKLTLNSWLQTYQILTNDVHFVSFLSYYNCTWKVSAETIVFGRLLKGEKTQRMKELYSG